MIIDKIKIGDIAYDIKDSSISDDVRNITVEDIFKWNNATGSSEGTQIIENFKTANDYQLGGINNGGIVTSSTSIVSISLYTAVKNMMFSVEEGYKYGITFYHVETNGSLAYKYHTGWTTENIIVPKGHKIRVVIAKSDNTVVDTAIFEKLWYEEIPEIYYRGLDDEDPFPDIHFCTASQSDGYIATHTYNSDRVFGVEFLRFDHDITIKNNGNNYGFTVFLYNEDGTEFVKEINGDGQTWTGTLKELVIPANTTFRIYMRLLTNYSIKSTSMTLCDVSSALTIEVETLRGYIDSNDNQYRLAQNNYYGVLKSNNYKRMVLDELVDFNTESLQSILVDVDRKRFIKLDASTKAKVYDYKGNYIKSITKGNTEHDNDICYVGNGIAYIVGAYYSINYVKTFFKWDIVKNVVTPISLSAITNNSNGSYRVVAGVCETYRNSGILYIVCADWYDDGSAGLNHQEGDKLSIYTYNISTGAINLVKEFDWDCVYVQGATCLNDILYVSCNTQTDISVSNYKGITIKMFDTKTWTLIDEVIIEGNFEPESINYIIENGTPKLCFGLGKYATISKLFKMELPF